MVAAADKVEHKTLAGALSAAQAEVHGAAKDAQNPFLAKKNRDGSLTEGTGMYVTLSSYIEAARPVLAKHGLSVITMPSHLEAPEGFASFTTVLCHASGEREVFSFAIPLVKKDAQGFGGTMTYARKYCLAAWLNMWAEDDDGETAVGRTPAKQSAPSAKKPTAKELIELLANAQTQTVLNHLKGEAAAYRGTPEWDSIVAVGKSAEERLEREAKDAAVSAKK